MRKQGGFRVRRIVYSEQQIEKAMSNSKASLKVEGLYVEKCHDVLVISAVKGEITHAEFINIAKERAKNAVKIFV